MNHPLRAQMCSNAMWTQPPPHSNTAAQPRLNDQVTTHRKGDMITNSLRPPDQYHALEDVQHGQSRFSTARHPWPPSSRLKLKKKGGSGRTIAQQIQP